MPKKLLEHSLLHTRISKKMKEVKDIMKKAKMENHMLLNLQA